MQGGFKTLAHPRCAQGYEHQLQVLELHLGEGLLVELQVEFLSEGQHADVAGWREGRWLVIIRSNFEGVLPPVSHLSSQLRQRLVTL